MLSGRSQSFWIQLSVFNSQPASSNHFGVKRGSLFIRIWVCESFFVGDVTSPLCAKLVTVLCASCSLSFTLRRIYFPLNMFSAASFCFMKFPVPSAQQDTFLISPGRNTNRERLLNNAGAEASIKETWEASD